MIARLLLIAGLFAFAGIAADPGQAAISFPAKKDEPKKPKDEPKKSPPKEEAKGPVTAPGDKGKSAPKKDALKKYDDVITKDAKTQPGVFAVHRIDEKVYFEIPQDKLGKLMMFRAEVAKGPSGTSFNGMALGTKFVRFERRAQERKRATRRSDSRWLNLRRRLITAIRSRRRSTDDMRQVAGQIGWHFAAAGAGT